MIERVKLHGYDCLQFTIKVTMKERWIPHFLSALKYMQYLGSVGSSRDVTLFSDGDGDFRPKFEWPDDLLDEPVEPMNDTGGARYYDAG